MCNYRGQNVLRKTSIILAKKATKSYTRTKTKGDKPVNIEKKKTPETVRANKIRKGPRACNYSYYMYPITNPLSPHLIIYPPMNWHLLQLSLHMGWKFPLKGYIDAVIISYISCIFVSIQTIKTICIYYYFLQTKSD